MSYDTLSVLSRFPKKEQFYKSFLKKTKLQYSNNYIPLPEWATTGKLTLTPNKLTDSQVRAFNYFKNSVDKKEQIFLTVLSGPGHGKTFLLKKFSNYLENKSMKYAILASTGAAALNAGGITLNNFLELGKYAPKNLEDFVFKSFSKKFKEKVRNLKFIILDEIAIIHSALFLFTIRRIEYVQGVNHSLSVITFGDFHQLKVCNGVSLIENPDNVENQFAKEGIKFFHQFKIVTLLENVRQAGDPVFQKILTEIREKRVSKETFEILKTRYVSNLTPEERSHFANVSIKIFPTNRLIRDYHKNRLSKWPNPKVIITDVISNKNSKLKLNSITLSEGLHVILTRNLLPQAGLVSGSLGQVKGIYYKHTSKVVKPFPNLIFISFPTYHGPTVEEGCIPITPESNSEFDISLNRKISVKSYPLKLAEAITCHASQGCTIKQGITLYLDSSGEKFFSYLLTGLSRIESLDKLMVRGRLDYDYFTNANFYKGHAEFLKCLSVLMQNEIKQ